MKSILPIAFALAALVSCGTAGTNVFRHAGDVAREHSEKMYLSLEGRPGRLPKTAVDDSLVTCSSRWWTSGFFPGTLWYLSEMFPEDTLLKVAAVEMTDRVLREQFNKKDHDTGFKMLCSAGHAYRLTGEEKYRRAIINGAYSLASRFTPSVGCIESWDRKADWEHPVIIDNMMNLELLFYAYGLTKDVRLKDIAISHADRTMKEHFRPDGSCYHVVNYDELTGDAVFKGTRQGASDSSAWSRGQAWALYSYTMMYRYTKEKRYLDMAVKSAEFVLNHPNMPEDMIPYWDYDAPDIPYEERDASAAAVMASGLLELSTFVPEKYAGKYFGVAEQQLKNLSSRKYMAEAGTNANFILMHSTGSKPMNSEVDVPLSYADYYFVEALMRYKNMKNAH